MAHILLLVPQGYDVVPPGRELLELSAKNLAAPCSFQRLMPSIKAEEGRNAAVHGSVHDDVVKFAHTRTYQFW